MACHIFAASDGPSARRVATDNSIDLTDISNGVWMCYTHGKMIDGDECRYKPETLANWRRIAELRAKIAHETGSNPTSLQIYDVETRLSPDTLLVSSLDQVASAVCEFYQTIGAVDIWGRSTALEMGTFCTEFVSNAFSYGDATTCTLSSINNSVAITLDGKSFSPSDLSASTNRRGGARSYLDLQTKHPNCLVSYEVGTLNTLRITVANSNNDVHEFTRCFVDVQPTGDADLLLSRLDSFESCSTIYITSESGFVHSHIHYYDSFVKAALAKGKRVIMVVGNTSPGALEYFAEILPELEFLPLALRWQPHQLPYQP